jgi:hypothetical protein
VDKALGSKVLGPIYNEHPYLFKSTKDRDYLVLLLFLMYEHQKGKDSLWHPYFQAIEPGELPCFWNRKVIQCLESQDLIDELDDAKRDFETDWGIMRKLMLVYSPEVFKLELCTYELYRRCACIITTRCFGWGLPSTIISPIGDCFNHSP